MLQKPANELKYDKLMSYFVAFVAKSDKQFLRLLFLYHIVFKGIFNLID